MLLLWARPDRRSRAGHHEPPRYPPLWGSLAGRSFLPWVRCYSSPTATLSRAPAHPMRPQGCRRTRSSAWRPLPGGNRGGPGARPAVLGPRGLPRVRRSVWLECVRRPSAGAWPGQRRRLPPGCPHGAARDSCGRRGRLPHGRRRDRPLLRLPHLLNPRRVPSGVVWRPRWSSRAHRSWADRALGFVAGSRRGHLCRVAELESRVGMCGENPDIDRVRVGAIGRAPTRKIVGPGRWDSLVARSPTGYLSHLEVDQPACAARCDGQSTGDGEAASGVPGNDPDVHP